MVKVVALSGHPNGVWLVHSTRGWFQEEHRFGGDGIAEFSCMGGIVATHTHNEARTGTAQHR